jgi:hypothetical protein
MPQPRALPRDLGRIFTVADARRRDVPAKRLRARDLDRPFSGVRVVRGEPETAVDDEPLAHDRAERTRVTALIDAYAPLMAEHAFIAGRSAIVWWGAAITHGTDLEVGVFEPERAPRRRGVKSRMLAPGLVHVTTQGGVRIATPASAWAMLGREVDVPELVRLGDQLVRIPRDDHGVPRLEGRLATIEHLRAAAGAGRRAGVAKLREALDLIRVGSMSPLETDARLELVRAGLPEPQLDVEVYGRDGRLLGIADGAYRDRRVLLEIEGDHHRTSRTQWERDLEKHAAYREEGWDLVRLTSSHIRGEAPRAASLVRAALLRAGHHP